MKIKSVGVFVLVFCIGVLSGRSHAKDRLVIGYTAITGIKAGLWVAEDAGIFDKHNIQAELLLITSASKMVQAMLGGDVPFAAAGGNAAVDANLSGADMVMLGVLALLQGPLRAQRLDPLPERDHASSRSPARRRSARAT